MTERTVETNEESVHPAVEGKSDDFRELFSRYYVVAYRVAFALLGDREAAEDVAQETMARASVRWPSLRRHPERRGWIGRVSANLARDAWRSQTTRRRRDTTAYREGSLTEPDRALAERLDLHAALARLPRRQREVLVLRFLADLPEEAVATHLGCSVGSVKQHAARALSRLRSVAAQEED